ncbi:rCG32727, isoform CRA_b [Rattus norvegicus]|uniref:RCG32727, isoform CRA_b n=1 Tax=Rattus norvegicus TaxID=10116 RepID=A6HDV6_RAT|nr:rCG32727, isoform CRA_b [Rattus norvegicus]
MQNMRTRFSFTVLKGCPRLYLKRKLRWKG